MTSFTKFVCPALLACFIGSALTTTAEANWQSQLANTAKETSVSGIMGECHVDSRVGSTVSVYINGVYRGTMGPSGDLYLNVGDFSYEVTYLRAVSSSGQVWTRTVTGSISSFHWIIY